MSLDLKREIKNEIESFQRSSWKREFGDDLSCNTDNFYLKPHYKYIHPMIYIGNTKAAIDKEVLAKYEFGAVLSCCKIYFPERDYYQDKQLIHEMIPMPDEANINLQSIFVQGADFIESMMKESNSVLVHCEDGLCKSVAMVVAFFMKNRCLDLLTSFELIHHKTVVKLKNSYIEQLIKFHLDIIHNRIPGTD